MTKQTTEVMDGATALIKTLEKHGVEYIFGYSGGAVIPIFDALITSGTKIKPILVRHEQGAVHMADGYARASGKPGVALVTSGPGAGNAITGLMTAQMDSVPLVLISGQQIRPMLGLDAFQEADVFNMSMSVVKHNYLVHEVNEVPRIVTEAFHLATTGRPGPVLIDMPKDVSSGAFTGDLHKAMDLPAYEHKYEVDRGQIEQIMDAWRKAKRPVILVGHGVLIAEAEAQLRKLAETMDTPVTNTLLGKGAFPETHALSLGMLGMHGTAYANKAMVECDFLLNVGSRFDDRIVGKTSEFCKDAFKAHIDIDASEIDKMIAVDASVRADAREALAELNAQAKPQKLAEWNTHLDSYKQKYPLHYTTGGDKLTMQQVIERLYEITEGKAVVATDVGQHQMWAAQFYKTDAPKTWLSSGGAGTMGFGMPAAIGAQFARPNDTVIAIVGDGGFQMTEYELATACIHKLPVKVFIFNNHYLGMVRQWQELFYDNRESGVDLVGNPDFVKFAESYGAKGINITGEADMEAGLREAFGYNDGPVIVNVEVAKTDNIFPMVPPGAALADMIIEPPTTKMDKPTGST